MHFSLVLARCGIGISKRLVEAGVISLVTCRRSEVLREQVVVIVVCMMKISFLIHQLCDRNDSASNDYMLNVF